jgi:hypothetical protein
MDRACSTWKAYRIWVKKWRVTRLLGWPRRWWNDNIKTDFRDWMVWHGLDAYGLRYEIVEGSREHSHESYGSKKCWEIFELLSEWWLLKKRSTPWIGAAFDSVAQRAPYALVAGAATSRTCVFERSRCHYCMLWLAPWPPLWSSSQSFWLQIQRSGFDSRRYQIFWEVVGLERGAFSLVSINEELLERKSSGSCLESREYGRRDPSCWPRGALYPQRLALTSLTNGGRPVDIVRSRTQATEFVLFAIGPLSTWRS